MDQSANVSIVGAGIAGLAAAIALAGKDRKVTVYERATRFEEVGAGLQLGPNAVRALQAIGAWDAVEPITSAPPAIRIHNGRTCRLLKEIELGAAFERRYGQPYRVAHRADLHGALADLASKHRNITMKLGHDVNATTLEGQVIAADGVRSATRSALFTGTAARAVPEILFRALVPMPPGVGIDCVNLWMFPGGHVVHYPVGEKPRLNIVAVTNGERPEPFFAEAHDALQRVISLAGSSWLEWPGAYVPVLPTWQKDNIRLIGDAAHATLPFLAQGAAMALEDVACLVSLQGWAARQARTLRLHQQTLKTGEIYHLSGLKAFARDQVIAMTSPAAFLKRLDWIYLG